MKYRFILFLLIVTLDACVDKFDVPSPDIEKILVVDGMITNDVGPYSVKLTYAHTINANPAPGDPVRSAVVEITENGTTSYTLAEEAPGVYTSTGLQGVLGNTYQLVIHTDDGKNYESVPAVLKPAGTLERFYMEVRHNAINQDSPNKPQDAIFLFADGSGDEAAQNLLRWRWKAVYEVNSEPEKKQRFHSRLQIFVPDPPYCSGYSVDEEYNLVYDRRPCTCCVCWVTLYSNIPAISDPASTQGLSFKKVYLGFIPITKNLFSNKLSIIADQLSLTEEAFAFWKLVNVQVRASEDIFQPNVVKIKGNMSCISHPDEDVLGIFSVSGSTSRRLDIVMDDIDPPPGMPDLLPDDCRVISGGSNVKPDFY